MWSDRLPLYQFSWERLDTKEEKMAKGKEHAPGQILSLLRQIGRTIWRAKIRFGTGEIF
jgi:hypothetical protein